MSESDQLDSENLICSDATQKEITFNFFVRFSIELFLILLSVKLSTIYLLEIIEKKSGES